MLNKFSYVFFGAIAAFFGAYFALMLREDFKTLDGQSYSWHGLEGKWVVVNYFAQWCAPCIKEIPELNEFASFAETRHDIALFAVNFDTATPDESRALLAKYGIEFDLMEEAPVRAPFERPNALPATFIISPDGELIARLDGEQTNQGLQQKLMLLQKNAQL